jgi:anti-anti-sigma factor
MKRNDPMLAPRAPAEAGENLAGRPVEPMPVPASLEPMPVKAAAEPLPAPAPVAMGEITITQHVEITPSQPDRRGACSERPAPGARRLSRHTLVLIGELDRGSTHTLEAEIERLCEARIAAITLDLTKLSGIDSAGVAVIAFRSRWCRDRGHELALIPGPRPVQRAFELAGVAQSLTFTDGEAAGAET